MYLVPPIFVWIKYLLHIDYRLGIPIKAGQTAKITSAIYFDSVSTFSVVNTSFCVLFSKYGDDIIFSFLILPGLSWHDSTGNTSS